MVNVSRRAHLSKTGDPFMPVPRMMGYEGRRGSVVDSGKADRELSGEQRPAPGSAIAGKWGQSSGSKVPAQLSFFVEKYT